MKQRVVVLTGAGISSQNDDGSKGIPTFRDSTDGLYNNIDLLSLVPQGINKRINKKHLG